MNEFSIWFLRQWGPNATLRLFALRLLFACSSLALRLLFVCSSAALCLLFDCSSSALRMLFVCSSFALRLLFVCSSFALCLLFVCSLFALRLLFVCSSHALPLLFVCCSLALVCCLLFVCAFERQTWLQNLRVTIFIIDGDNQLLLLLLIQNAKLKFSNSKLNATQILINTCKTIL